MVLDRLQRTTKLFLYLRLPDHQTTAGQDNHQEAQQTWGPLASLYCESSFPRRTEDWEQNCKNKTKHCRFAIVPVVCSKISIQNPKSTTHVFWRRTYPSVLLMKQPGSTTSKHCTVFTAWVGFLQDNNKLQSLEIARNVRSQGRHGEVNCSILFPRK